MDTMRDALNAAVEEVESIDGDPIDEPLPDEPGDSEPEEPSEEPEPREPSEEPAPEEPDKLQAKADKQRGPKDSIKAPVDWGPKDRELWSKIPRNLQEKIVSREKEMADVMANTQQARQTHDWIQSLAQSYAPVMAAEGVANPLEAIQGLFKTVASLRMGTPQDKAAQMANLIKHYGIDIQALDSVLAGQAPSASPNSQLESLIEQKMQPVNQLMQQMGQYQEHQKQQVQHSAQGQIQEFAKDHEFLNDVRNDMADLIDMAAKQGRNLSLQEAYDRAIALNPEISQIIDQRKKQEALLGNNQNLAAKHNAASSLAGKRSGIAAGEPMNLRESIQSAWDDAMR